jgi:hypothetical protein
MINTDDLQLSTLDPGPPLMKRFTLWKWTPEESAKWTTFRTDAEDLYALYSDEDKVTKTVRKDMNNLVISVMKYDLDPLTGHHLLDKVGALGTVDDALVL